jgi:beta-glucosidase
MPGVLRLEQFLYPSKFHHSSLKFLLLVAFLLIGSIASSAEASDGIRCPPLLRKPATLKQAEAQAQTLMDSMTPEERFDFVCGAGLSIKPVPRLGIPAIILNDASGGCHLHAKDALKKSTAFPCTLSLAATWDPVLAGAYAGAIAEEFRTAGMHFILGPGINMYRNSQCGRNFEYLGEDPYLSARMVSAYVRSVQSLNVAATLKHYLCNESDFHRRAANALVSERALNEIYLVPFKAGVQAGAWGVMSSYNLVNGEWMGENRHLITDVLRGELGFQFLVMTDWGSSWHGDKLADAGINLEMPDGYALRYDRQKVFAGPAINRMAVGILKTCIYSGLYEMELTKQFHRPDWISRYPQHAAIARKANEEGIVLLKNSGLLPLDESLPGAILVTGNSATIAELGGLGSGHVQGYDLKTYLEAVRETYRANPILYVENPTDAQIRSAGLVLVFTGRPITRDYKEVEVNFGTEEAEARDHPYILPDDTLVTRCVNLNSRTIVNLTCGGGAQMDWAGKAAAIIMAMDGGQTGPDALLDILMGKVNPSGKLPFTIERHFSDSCAAGYIEHARPGATNADSRDMAARVGNSKGCLPSFLANKDGTEIYTYDIPYKEGVFIGYRWYDSRNIEPRFPFGFGLSYTAFRYSDIKLSSPKFLPGSSLTVEAKIKNTGSREGAEIAELYVSELHPTVSRPPRELKAFQRVDLGPGEAGSVSFELNQDAFSYYDDLAHHWKTNSGEFEIEIGASSRDIRLKTTVSVLNQPRLVK